MKRTNQRIREFSEYLDSEDWTEYSCGRSTDYIDEFQIEDSIKNIKDKFNKLFVDSETNEETKK